MRERKIIVNSNCYHGYSIFDAIDGIKNAGFRYIELTATKGWTEHVFPTMSFSELQKVKDTLEKNGIEVLGFSGHANIMDSDRIPDFILNIHLAHFFGAKTIVTSIGEAHLKDMEKAGDDEVRKNILTFLPLLEKYDMFLSLETHGEHGSGERIKEVIGSLETERVGICYDTANVIFYGGVEDLSDLDSSAERVNYLHIKDKSGGKREWNFPALGCGYVDFKGIFKLLDDKNNDSPLSIEIEFTEHGPKDLDEVNEALRKSAEYLKSLGYEL